MHFRVFLDVARAMIAGLRSFKFYRLFLLLVFRLFSTGVDSLQCSVSNPADALFPLRVSTSLSLPPDDQTRPGTRSGLPFPYSRSPWWRRRRDWTLFLESEKKKKNAFCVMRSAFCVLPLEWRKIELYLNFLEREKGLKSSLNKIQKVLHIFMQKFTRN